MMAQSETSGPALGQMVIYIEVGTIFYPGVIVSIGVSGTVRLTSFPPGLPPTDRQNVSFDPTGQTGNAWRYARSIESNNTQTVNIIPSNAYVAEDGITLYTNENASDFYITES
jgi:hypothetical protein